MMERDLDYYKIFSEVDPVIEGILVKAYEGKDISSGEAYELLNLEGRLVWPLLYTADIVRQKLVGKVVTFVVNRNINFTNICKNRCLFCAFRVDEGDKDGYFYSINRIVRMAKEAWERGATEVCIQGGCKKGLTIEFYAEILRSIKRELPDIHIHAFSPQEVFHGSRNSGIRVEEGLKFLKEEGLDTMPGTAAEILDDEVRMKVCPQKVDTKTWIEIIKTAHCLGIKTSSTIMYGHIENNWHRKKHLKILRDIQKETGGFTEFVPLPFIHINTPLYEQDSNASGSSGLEDLKLYAVARLFFANYINNIQASWVKLGPKLAQTVLFAGGNDLGGTLYGENISKAAGAIYGEEKTPKELRNMIGVVGRIPAQRTTDYKILKKFND